MFQLLLWNCAKILNFIRKNNIIYVWINSHLYSFDRTYQIVTGNEWYSKSIFYKHNEAITYSIYYFSLSVQKENIYENSKNWYHSYHIAMISFYDILENAKTHSSK